MTASKRQPPPKRKRGRPKNKPGPKSILTAELSAKIVAIVRAGNFIETAAASAGISKNSLYEWLKKGARAKRASEKTGKPIPRDLRIHAEFAEAMHRATAEAEVVDVLTIRTASKQAWQAAAWHLERKYPERWGRRIPVELSGPGGGPIKNETVEQVHVYLPSNGRDDPALPAKTEPLALPEHDEAKR